jgi:hypothetical protein
MIEKDGLERACNILAHEIQKELLHPGFGGEERFASPRIVK